MDIYLPKFGIYQGKVAPIVLRATQSLDVLIFSKKVLPDVRSDIRLAQRNIALPDNLSGIKKYTYIQACYVYYIATETRIKKGFCFT